MTITTKEKQILKSYAHKIKPTIIIGKEGLNYLIIHNINKALEKNELIKIKFNSFKSNKKVLSKSIESACNAISINIIGHILILYKQNSDFDKRIYLI